MPRVFKPNPHSLVHQAIHNCGGIKSTALQLKVTEQTVAQWARIDRIPRKQLLNFSVLADIPPLDLIEYAERSSKPYFFQESKTKHASLDVLLSLYRGDTTIEQAYLQTDISPRTLKQLLTLWGDRVPLLVQTLKSDESKAVRAARLSVTVRQLNRLIKTYVKVEKAIHPRVAAHKEAQKRWDNYRQWCAKVVRGDLTVLAAAESLELSSRQLHRHMEKYVEPYGFQAIKRLPRSFRSAYAYEIENPETDIVRPLINYWHRHKLQQIRLRTPQTFKRESFLRCLIAVLLGETTFVDIVEAKEATKSSISDRFDDHLRMLHTSWNKVSTWPIHHQNALADLLSNMEKPHV